ncbi:MAG: exosortase/archaeosortase family protein [Anaerolineae bacterium]|nr:exosortase/archaeosortase family protein [Gemmatimonadaceae bacterium]
METGAPPASSLFARAGQVIPLRVADVPGALGRFLPALVTAIAFLALFAQPLVLLVQDWWQLPEAGHGLLLAPMAVWLAWRSGIRDGATPNHAAGIAILLVAVFIRYVSGLAAELFTMRESMVLALAGLTVYHYGVRQLLWWWLPFTLAALTVPLPELVTQQLALPLQFQASRIGAWLLSSRHVPVELAGNIIRIPGRELFVTEACSGLRSLTALVSLGILMGGVALRHPVSRLLLLALAIPVAILINGVRVFITGFLVYFVSPSFGEGFMHITEGWLLFLVSFASLGLLAWGFVLLERYVLDKSNTRNA